MCIFRFSRRANSRMSPEPRVRVSGGAVQREGEPPPLLAVKHFMENRTDWKEVWSVCDRRRNAHGV